MMPSKIGKLVEIGGEVAGIVVKEHFGNYSSDGGVECLGLTQEIFFVPWQWIQNETVEETFKAVAFTNRIDWVDDYGRRMKSMVIHGSNLVVEELYDYEVPDFPTVHVKVGRSNG